MMAVSDEMSSAIDDDDMMILLFLRSPLLHTNQVNGLFVMEL
jgi:hypothetical protein